jgi:hypothetical protein
LDSICNSANSGKLLTLETISKLNILFHRSHYYSADMEALRVFLVYVAILSLGAADIRINTEKPTNSCLRLKPHVVNNVELQKCCLIGWHLNLSEFSEPCVEGDRDIEIDMVFITDKDSMIYEPLELTNYTIQLSTIFKWSEFPTSFARCKA